jgi:hypothetical protein
MMILFELMDSWKIKARRFKAKIRVRVFNILGFRKGFGLGSTVTALECCASL